MVSSSSLRLQIPHTYSNDVIHVDIKIDGYYRQTWFLVNAISVQRGVQIDVGYPTWRGEGKTIPLGRNNLIISIYYEATFSLYFFFFVSLLASLLFLMAERPARRRDCVDCFHTASVLPVPVGK